MARFFAGLAVGLVFGLVALILIWLAAMGGGGGLLTMIIGWILLWGGLIYAFRWSFSIGLFIGPFVFAAGFAAYAWNKVEREKVASEKAAIAREKAQLEKANNRLKIASKEPPVFSKPHRLIEIGAPLNAVGPKLWFGLLSFYDIQLNDGRQLRAYKAASGAECWQDDNAAINLELLESGIIRGLPNDPCVALTQPQPGGDAIVVSEQRHANIYTQAEPEIASIIGERLGGVFELKTKMAVIDHGPQRGHQPHREECGKSDAIAVTLCLATKQGVPFRERDAIRTLAIASRHVDAADPAVSARAKRLVETFKRQLEHNSPKPRAP